MSSSPPAAESEPTEVKATVKATDAKPPFDPASKRADLIIRSSDHVDFHVQTFFLTFASSVFIDMLAMPHPPAATCGEEEEEEQNEKENENWKDGRPIVRLTEDSRLIRTLLTFVYPGDPPPPSKLEEVEGIIEAAQKYDMPDVGKRARRALVDTPFLMKEPLRVFVLAHRHKFKEEAKLAARHMLRFPMLGSQVTEGKYRPAASPKPPVPAGDKSDSSPSKKPKATPPAPPIAKVREREWFRTVKPEPATLKELDYISAGTLQRLQDYYIRCEQAAKNVAHCNRWLQDKEAAWLSCGDCGTWETKPFLVSAPARAPARWWSTYMRSVCQAFMNAPVGETVMKPELLDEMLLQAGDCKQCRGSAYTGTRNFFKDFAEEVDKAVSKVDPRFNCCVVKKKLSLLIICRSLWISSFNWGEEVLPDESCACNLYHFLSATAALYSFRNKVQPPSFLEKFGHSEGHSTIAMVGVDLARWISRLTRIFSGGDQDSTNKCYERSSHRQARHQ
jgi:hypothetical protein